MPRSRSCWLFLIPATLTAFASASNPPPRQSDAGTTEKQSARSDSYGDPLPDQAIARLGTVRWRHGSYVSSVAFSPDGATLASVGGDRVLRLTEVATGSEIRRVKFRGTGPLLVAFAPDGKTLVVAGSDIPPWFVDPATGSILGQPAEAFTEVGSLAFAPDSKTVAIADDEEDVHLCDLATRKFVRRFSGVLGPVKAIAFARDGKTLALGDAVTVRLFDIATREVLRRFRPHQGTVTR